MIRLWITAVLGGALLCSVGPSINFDGAWGVQRELDAYKSARASERRNARASEFDANTRSWRGDKKRHIW